MQYVVSTKGRRLGVILSMTEYKRLLNAAEELASIRAYDAAKRSGDEAIPFEQAIDEIERGRG